MDGGEQGPHLQNSGCEKMSLHPGQVMSWFKPRNFHRSTPDPASATKTFLLSPQSWLRGGTPFDDGDRVVFHGTMNSITPNIEATGPGLLETLLYHSTGDKQLLIIPPSYSLSAGQSRGDESLLPERRQVPIPVDFHRCCTSQPDCPGVGSVLRSTHLLARGSSFRGPLSCRYGSPQGALSFSAGLVARVLAGDCPSDPRL